MLKKTKKEPTPKVAPEMTKGEWMQKYWRQCAAFMYMICCLADFAIFPIMFTVVQFWETQAANDAFRQWVPITLQGGGLFHVSMCAVLGVSAYGRTQEKLNGTAGAPTPAGLPSPTLSSATPAVTPSFGGSTNGGFNAPSSGTTAFSSPAAGGFGSPSSFATPVAAPASSFGATDPSAGFGQPIATTASGKKIVPDFGQPLL
jgi:hypothetical protein